MQAATQSFRIVPKKQAKKSARNRELQRKIRNLAAAMLDLAESRHASFPQFSVALQRHVVERRINAVIKEAAHAR